MLNWECVEVIRKKKDSMRYINFIFGWYLTGFVGEIGVGVETKMEEENSQTDSPRPWERVHGSRWKEAETPHWHSRTIMGFRETKKYIKYTWGLSYKIASD